MTRLNTTVHRLRIHTPHYRITSNLCLRSPVLARFVHVRTTSTENTDEWRNFCRIRASRRAGTREFESLITTVQRYLLLLQFRTSSRFDYTRGCNALALSRHRRISHRCRNKGSVRRISESLQRKGTTFSTSFPLTLRQTRSKTRECSMQKSI